MLTATPNEDRDRNGVMVGTFDTPRAYTALIKLKWFVMGLLGVRDKRLGIDDITSQASVLEVGCGPRLDLPSSELNLDGCSLYVGLDYSLPFVMSANSGWSSDHVGFVQGDAGRLPVADNSFDVVLASFTIHHVPHDPQLVVDEMFRVARKWVVIFDHVKSANKSLASIQRLYWRHVDGGHHYLTHEEWQAALRDRYPIRSLQTGALGKHVVKMYFRVNDSDTVYRK